MSPQDEHPDQSPQNQRPDPQGGYHHGQVLGGGAESQQDPQPPAGGPQQPGSNQTYPGSPQQPGPYQGQPGYQQPGPHHQQSGPYQQQSGPYQQHSGPYQQPGSHQQPGGMPPYPQQMPPYPQQGFGYGPRIPATPDGEPLSGWWRRVAARLLDGIIVGIGSLPLTGYFYWQYTKVVIDYTRDMMDQAVAGQPQTQFNLPWEAYKWAIPATLIGLVVAFVYEYFFLTKTGATLGKKALGISVRLRDRPGPPPGSAVAKRFGLYYGLSLLGAVPLVGSIFGLLGLLNNLWPLWDDKKQALHDKVAATNVVRKP